jgi:hypothetical protein
LLRRKFVHRREKVKKEAKEIGEKCIVRSFIICTFQQVLLGLSNQGGWEWLGM